MDSEVIAERFVRARLDAEALPAFPGTLPTTLNSAYAYQDRAISLWPDHLVGWKVGGIGQTWLRRVGEDRLVGPIFRRGMRVAPPDAHSDRAQWTPEEAARLVTGLHVGVEIAGSPLAAINELGPTAVVSDFGSHGGLLLGPAISGWHACASDSLTCETFIDGRSVGQGAVRSMRAGLLAALAFALGRCARRGLPMKAGYLVASGAVTGSHAIRIGQSACVRFGGVAEISCRALPAMRHGGSVTSRSV